MEECSHQWIELDRKTENDYKWIRAWCPTCGDIRLEVYDDNREEQQGRDLSLQLLRL